MGYQEDRESFTGEDPGDDCRTFDNEHQAAYALSQLKKTPDDRAKVRALVRAGRFVVVQHYERFCRLTDASLGDAVAYVSDYATLLEAEADPMYLSVGPEAYVTIDGPRAPREPDPILLNDDLLPSDAGGDVCF